MITRSELLKNYTTGVIQTIPFALEGNLEKLLTSINEFRKIYGKPIRVSSGYRDPEKNASVGGSKKSNHMMCLAVDFVDIDSLLDSYCIANQDVLEHCGLYLEHPKWTNGWCHLQCVAPLSGRRIFIPSVNPPLKKHLDELFITLKI